MNGKVAMVVGGAGGMGAAITQELLNRKYNKVYVVDRGEPDYTAEGVEFVKFNLVSDDITLLKQFDDIDTLIVTAGIGRLDYFSTNSKVEIETTFKVNAIATAELLNIFYDKISGEEAFYCAVMSSIAGMVSSPLYALYAATKASVSRLVESLNAELAGQNKRNRILAVAPGKIDGTAFHGGQNRYEQVMPLASEILDRMFASESLFVPNFEVYKNVIARYQENAEKFGLESYQYKLEKNPLETKRRIKVGYLTGCFDLFHVGHLNLLRRAKQYCDYLVVGLHPDGSHKGKELYIPLQERMEIVGACKYVDKVMVCTSEDIDAYEELRFDYLFVGSDYQGTERFNRYERELGPKGVKIIYFPYTKGISSTQLREQIK